MIEDCNPGEHLRLKLGIQKAVEHAEERMKKLWKGNKLALKQEFQEWMEDPDCQDNDIEWMNEYKYW